MKKFTPLLVAASLAVSLAACDSSDQPTATSSSSPVSEPTTPTSDSTVDSTTAPTPVPTVPVPTVPTQPQTVDAAVAFVDDTLKTSLVAPASAATADWAALWTPRATDAVRNDMITGPTAASLNDVYSDPAVIPYGNSVCADTRGVMWFVATAAVSRTTDNGDAQVTWDQGVAADATLTFTTKVSSGPGSAQALPLVIQDAASAPIKVTVPYAVEAVSTVAVAGTPVAVHVFIPCSMEVSYEKGAWVVSSPSSVDMENFMLPASVLNGSLPQNTWVAADGSGLLSLPNTPDLAYFKASMGLA